MQTVTAEWKATHSEMLLPETFIDISYDITEPGLQNLAVASGTMEAPFSEADTLTDISEKDSRKHASLEWNAWGLDGSFSYFSKTMRDFGYVTQNLCGVDSAFAVPPAIEIRFASVRTIPIAGITITWSTIFNEWAEDFLITVYKGTVQVTQKMIAGNKDVKSIIWMGFQNYDRIVIEVSKWCLPYRRARAINTYVGISTTYTKHDLLNFSNSQSVDLLSAALPKNELVFSLDNSNDKWNPDNPTGAERYLLERQKIQLRYGMRIGDGIEWINGGSFWLSEWNTPANGIEASFTARDAIAFGDVKYTGVKTGTLYTLAQAALNQLGEILLEVSYSISNNLKNTSISIANDEDDYTVSDILQLVAHAGCCVLYQDRDAVIHIEPRSTALSDYEITQDVSYSYPEYTISKPLKAVEISYGDDQITTLQAGTTGEVQTVDNPMIQTAAVAKAVGEAAKALLVNRKTVTGECRADPRLDATDIVKVHSKYATNTVVITDISYSTTGGACRGHYTGRVIDSG